VVRRYEPKKTEEPPRERAHAMALRALAHRPRTEAEIRARLARAELAAEADETVAWLLRLGYLDDAAYARARARGLLSGGRAGPRLAERRLRAAGIAEVDARAAIRDALEAAGGAGEGDPEVALCRALATRRARGADPATLDDKARARLTRWLLGRGFAGGVVARVVGTFEDSEV
jgi:regulatory protein